MNKKYFQHPGIYLIRNRKNGHSYIGQSKNIWHRWETHKHELRKGKHFNPYLQHSWKLHGEECFTFEVLEFCEILELAEKEQCWIVKLCPAYNNYMYMNSSKWTKEMDKNMKQKREQQFTDNLNDIPCMDCHQEYELIAGSSSERCFYCNQKYLKDEKSGKKDRWHRWVYGGDKNPG